MAFRALTAPLLGRDRVAGQPWAGGTYRSQEPTISTRKANGLARVTQWFGLGVVSTL